MGHLPARAEELADRHRNSARTPCRRPGGRRLGGAGRVLRRRAADRVHFLRDPAWPVGGQERGRAAAPASGTGLHHRVGRGRAHPAGHAGRPGPADRLPRPHAGQCGGAGRYHHGVEDLHSLRGGIRFGDHPRPRLRTAGACRLPASRAARLVPGSGAGPHGLAGRRRRGPRRGGGGPGLHGLVIGSIRRYRFYPAHQALQALARAAASSPARPSRRFRRWRGRRQVRRRGRAASPRRSGSCSRRSGRSRRRGPGSRRAPCARTARRPPSTSRDG